jgi:2'-5' RNA ligase
MRLFVAINLPASERRRIHRATKTLREADIPVRWVGLDQYHVTMRFLGEVTREGVGVVENAVRTAAAMNGVFDVRLAGCGAFPSIRNPRVIWLGAEPSPSLRSLKQDMERALSDSGLDRDVRAFHPHLTLGRISQSGRAGAFRGFGDQAAALDYEGTFRVKSLDLMRSRQGPEGSRYSIVSSSKLAGR